MRSEFQPVLFEEQTKNVLAVIAKMKIDLENYAKNEKAIPTVLAQRERIIILLLDYITNIVPEHITFLEKKINTVYDNGYKSGIEDTEKKYVASPDRFLQPDLFRELHNAAQKNKWNDHF